MNSKENMFVDYAHITLERRLVPFIVVFVLFLIFFAFMIGYFLGVKHTTDEFITQIRQETMADQLLMNAHTPTQQAVAQPEEITAAAKTAAIETTSQSIIVADAEPVLQEQHAPLGQEASIPTSEKAPTLIRYSAELIGFGTKHAAEEFMHRVSSYNTTPLFLKERVSKSPRGRRIQWYQVVTNTYEQKEELQHVLDLLIKKEHLHDIKIVAYTATKKDIA